MANNQEKIQVLPKLVSATLLSVANIFIFNTIVVFRDNPLEFEAGLLTMSPELILWAGVAVVLILLPGLIFPLSWLRRYSSLVLALGILTWIQGSFLLWDYGVFDGRTTHWQQFDALGRLDIGIWCSVMALFLYFANRIQPFIHVLAWILIIGHAALLLVLGGPDLDEWVKVPDTRQQAPEAMLEVSKKENIFHIILDSMQTDVFLESVERAGLQDELSGFTLFFENAGVTAYTSLALPQIFAGVPYDGSQLPEEYYKSAIDHGFQNTLYDAGYTVNLIPQLSMRNSRYTNYYQFPAIYMGSAADIEKLDAVRLLDVALFRSSPHFLRKALYDQGNWFLLPLFMGDAAVSSFQEKAFFRDYTAGLKLGGDAPAYHFVHLSPPHPPYVTLANGRYAGAALPNTRENYLNESKAIVKLIVRFLQKLKSLGVYDNALIILQGDHGSQIEPLVEGREIETCLPRLTAMLAVKRPGSTGDLTISNSPSSLLDVAPTVLEAIDENEKSLFELDESGQRNRPFVIFDGEGDKRSLVNYTISGSVYDPQSCHRENSVAINSRHGQYELGTEIQFGMMGNGDAFMGPGWSVCQTRHCWSTENLAEIDLPVGKTDTDLLLEVVFIPFVDADKLPRQRIGVDINGDQLAEWDVSEKIKQHASVRIPSGLVRGKTLHIKFHLPDAASPRTLGLGGDERRLGIALSTMRLVVNVSGHSGTP